MRKSFSQILNDSNIDIVTEYNRIYTLFFKNEVLPGYTLCGLCDRHFTEFPYRNTCINLADFNETFNFDLCERCAAWQIDIDRLVLLCEYSYNLVKHILTKHNSVWAPFILHIDKVVEKIGYVGINKNGLTDFVPKKAETIIAAESVDDSNISYDILKYNHHSMKGDLERKKNALISFATYFENKRKELKEFNQNFERNLFTMFNEFNIRHDNNGKNPLLENITDEKLEEYYDLTYELCLTAFSILGGMDSNKKAKQLRTKLGK